MRFILWTGLYVLCSVVCCVRSANDEMANDFLMSKWTLWYKILDVNHDGKLSIEDVQETWQAFTDFHKMELDKAERFKGDIEGWWDKYILRGNKGELSEQQFVDALNKDFVANKTNFIATMTQCSYDIFVKVIDANEDGYISEAESLIVLEAYGHTNVDLDIKFFKDFNPTDGLIPIRQIADSWIDFTASEDDSKKNIVKDDFEGDV